MKYLSLLLSLLLLVSCSSSISSFKGTVHNLNQSNVQVDCSDAVNRDKKGAIEALGYTCTVEVTKDTIIMDNNDKQITIDELKEGQIVKVLLTENKNISESVNSREVTAKTIHIVN